jgi:hypothetical protein
MQTVQIIYHYQRSENIDGIVVNLTLSTPSLDLAYNRNQSGDITMTQHQLA